MRLRKRVDLSPIMLGGGHSPGDSDLAIFKVCLPSRGPAEAEMSGSGICQGRDKAKSEIYKT